VCDGEVLQSRNPFNGKKGVGPGGGGCPKISLVCQELIKRPAQFPGYIGSMDEGPTAVMVSLAVTVREASIRPCALIRMGSTMGIGSLARPKGLGDQAGPRVVPFETKDGARFPLNSPRAQPSL
jgi:hypothetical protein